MFVSYDQRKFIIISLEIVTQDVIAVRKR